MNPSTFAARTVVDELVRAGVREAVLAPGSRSAPLAMALHDADTQGRLRLHVRVDERAAGFLALGLAKGSRRPVSVVTTSGTAVANLHPAVLEAHHSGVPLLVLSADRPAALRGTGANQTAPEQPALLGTAVRVAADWPVGDGDGRDLRAAVCRLLAAATGVRTRLPGPVHLNLQLREPLVPDPADDPGAWPAGRPDGAPWTVVEPEPAGEPARLRAGPRTVVLAGDGSGPPARQLAERAGWPLLAEPSSGSRTGTFPIAAYRLLLGAPQLGGAVERVVVLGHPTLSRPVSRLLARDDVEVVAVGPRGSWTDAGHRVSRVVPAVTVEGDPGSEADTEWLDAWRAADAAAMAAVAAELEAHPGLPPHAVARAVSAAVPPGGLLVVGPSSPVRDLDLMAVSTGVGERRMVMANRGLAGIDGVVSTAVGISLARRPTRSLAYVGDLTFLHDANALLIGPHEPRPDLTVVVANDDGGSIFAGLEQGGPDHADSFERVFATPTGTDLAALCAAHGVRHRRVTDADALTRALAEPPAGLEVVEAAVSRADRRQLDDRLRAAVERTWPGAGVDA
jgi:2-succinyl-5-enolpyruvyl-6-hydroxy-3-cyclohexene-1-carboxylate synthase